MQLEGIVSKLEASAKAEARERDADDDEASRRPFRRGHLRGEVAASEAVDEVEAVAAPGEGEPSAEADLSTTERKKPPGGG